MRRAPLARSHARPSSKVSRRFLCELLEDRTTPAVLALEALAADAPAAGDVFHILEPIPAVVAGVAPDSPDLRIDANDMDSPYGGGVGIEIHSTLGDFLCSGTAISPTHILTAAHCLDVNDDGDSDEITGFTIYVNYGGSPSQIIEVGIGSGDWEVHPDWTGFNRPSINDDLGIITLPENLEPGVPIYPLYTGNLAGQELEIVGYGTTGTPSGYQSGTAGTIIKRIGKNVAGAFIGQDDAGRPAANEVWRADFDGATSTTNSLNDGLTLGNSVETTLGGGDSGGPSFVNVGGQLYLAGVNTHTAAVIRGFFQILNPPAYGSILGGINVAPYVAWINSVIGAPPDTTAPVAPTGLTATAGNSQVTLNWADNTEADLAGYNVYRGAASGGPFTKINVALVANSAYLDGTAVNDTTYFYQVTAVDASGNESAASNEVSATPSGAGGSSPGVLYFTLQNDGNVGGPGGFAAANEDIIAFDGVNYQLFFDGSAFGLGGPSGGFSTDAVAVLDNGGTTEILMSFAQAGVISGVSLGLLYDADIVKFTVTAFNADGSVAAGVWSLFFDGSDVGLSSGLFSTNSAEGIDGIDVLSDGRLLISTHGNVSVPGVSAADEDILVFTPTSLGSTTAGSWSWFFDGSDVGLAADSEDVDGVAVLQDGAAFTVYLSTVADFATNGVSGTGGDVFVFHPTSLGSTTAGAYDAALFLDGSAQGLGSNNVLDISFKKSLTLPSSFGLNIPRRSAAPETEDADATRADVNRPPVLSVTARYDLPRAAVASASSSSVNQPAPVTVAQQASAPIPPSTAHAPDAEVFIAVHDAVGAFPHLADHPQPIRESTSSHSGVPADETAPTLKLSSPGMQAALVKALLLETAAENTEPGPDQFGPTLDLDDVAAVGMLAGLVASPPRARRATRRAG